MSKKVKEVDEDIIASVIKQLNKQFGKGTIFALDEESVDRNYDSISTGSLGLDNALGNGGWVKGRIVEVFGVESVGKTTLILNTMKEALRSDTRPVLFVDVEHSLDLRYVRNIIGDNYKRVHVTQPDSAEKALDTVIRVAESGGFSVIAIDSVAGLAPKAEIEGTMDDSQIAVVARLMSKSLRIIHSLASKSDTLVIYSNQLRDTIKYAPITPGGRALKYYASARVQLKPSPKGAKGDGVFKTLATVQKNKCSAPYKVAHIHIVYGEGISKEHELVEHCTNFGLLKLSGSWYSYKGENVGQGASSVIAYFREHPDLVEELEAGVMEVFKANE